MLVTLNERGMACVPVIPSDGGVAITLKGVGVASWPVAPD